MLTVDEDINEDDSKPLQETTVKRKRWYRLIKPKAFSSHRSSRHISPKSSTGNSVSIYVYVHF